jgi:cyclopropane fatty-acyl-phospholipid synthase-like methyltransferase
VLELGSADGYLGEYICNYLRSKGKRPTLTLVDMSAAHLRENKNKATRKIRADLLSLDLTGKGAPFDLIVMRSVLHYFPTRALQVRVLKRVRAHLAPGGAFLNQAFIAATRAESKLRKSLNRWRNSGNRLMPYQGDVPAYYRQAGFSRAQVMGDLRYKPTLREDIQRRDLTSEDIVRTREKIARVPARLRPNLTLTRHAYKRILPFRVYAATRAR